jgi:integrase
MTMALPKNLHKRDGTYYARIYIPKSLQPLFDGKREKWISLGTKDAKEARNELAAVVAHWTQVFQRVGSANELSPGSANLVLASHYRTTVSTGDIERSTPTAAEIDAAIERGLSTSTGGPYSAVNDAGAAELVAIRPMLAQQRRERRLKVLKAQLGQNDSHSIEHEVAGIIKRHGYTVPRNASLFREVCLQFIRTEIAALQTTEQRALGDFAEVISDPVVQRILSTSTAAVSEPVDTLMDLFGRYKSDNPNGIRTETLEQVEQNVQLFADFIGPTVSTDMITKKHVGDYKDLLLQYPVQATQTKVFAGMDLRQTVEANQIHGKRPLARRTVNRYLSSLSGFFNWLEARGRMTSNPVHGLMTKPKGQEAKKGKPKTFTDAQITQLLSAPLFTGCQDTSWKGARKSGSVMIRDHRYWIPQIMMYSGARPAEIAQLHCSDLYEENGIWLFDINDDGGNKRVKRQASRRLIPVHSHLLKIGLLSALDAAKQANHTQLFAEVEIPETGQIAAQFSREFNRYLAFVGLKEDAQLRAYSLRHGFIDKARAGGFMDYEIALIVGHEDSLSMPAQVQTTSYGQTSHGTMEHRKRIVESVEYV